VHRLSIGEKREFYANLARLIRSGSSLPAALDLLARDTPRGLRDFLRSLNNRVKNGEPLGDALLGQPGISELEATIISAAGRGGRLDRGCDQLARYFEALGRARKQSISRSIYPAVVLHLTILVVNIEALLNGGLIAYLKAVLIPLIYIYAIVVALWFAWRALAGAGRTNAFVDTLLRLIPGVGAIRERFALARFFATLDSQLEAQVNIWDAFANAARTSGSARMISAAHDALPMLQSGERLSEALAQKRVLPDDYIRSFRVAEQAGELDAELTAMAQRSEDSAVAVLERWSEWLPKIIYMMVLLYGAWQIVAWYSGYMKQISSFDPFNM
jgi:type II secretory pathway component PulF